MPSRDDAILAERRQKTKRSYGVRINQTDLSSLALAINLLLPNGIDEFGGCGMLSIC
jgi:hypothetical protein